VPEAVALALHAWATEHAAGLRVLPPESLHATLVFLGERPEEDVERVGAALGAVAAPVGKLSLGRAAALGRGSALAFDLADAGGEATALQGRLAAKLGVVEPRSYRPHVTVARGRDIRRRGWPPPPGVGAFRGTALTLFRSRPGSQYESLVSVPLDVGA
jgi:2'-5' RNA ligase